MSNDTYAALVQASGERQILAAFDLAFTEFDRLVCEVPVHGWSAGSGCSEWALRDVVNHLVSEALWAPHVLGKEALDEVGDRYDGDVVGDDPRRAWRSAASGSHNAFHTQGALKGIVHLSYGDAPASEYGWQMATDLAVHAWDLAYGMAGAEWRVPEELAHMLYEQMAPRTDHFAASGIAAPPLPAAFDTTAPWPVRLLALLGRDAGA